MNICIGGRDIGRYERLLRAENVDAHCSALSEHAAIDIIIDAYVIAAYASFDIAPQIA